MSYAFAKNPDKKQYAQAGFGLVEIVIVTTLISGALFGFAQAGWVSVRLLASERDRLEATLLAREALEAARAMRDESWAANIAWRTSAPLASPSLRYYPVIQNSKWILATTSPGLVNGVYNRFVKFERVSRDSQDRIVSTGGSDDPGTRKVTASATSSTVAVTLATYMTDFQSYLGRPQEIKAVSFEGASTDADIATFPSDNTGGGDPAQGFTTLGDAISVSKVELFLRRATASPSDVFVELRASPTGTVLGSSNIISGPTIASTSPSWVEFRFDNALSLAANTKYYIRLRSVPSSTDAFSGSTGKVYWDYLQSGASGPYAGGEARRFVGRLSSPGDAGASLDQYDYGFRVYDLQ
ncbi:MAG: hypothetical protein HY221_01415 [Candidatus Sungbacteria bacterium]|uniref:Uncharacterized protein n=1 Tax=Candidatus Sungiibacteriota bacterium TaxID=2750080 RepID=A0A932VQY4_9BACT|nr:hypothetical protein [Candidatus Sungbacteria bacterium]